MNTIDKAELLQARDNMYRQYIWAVDEAKKTHELALAETDPEYQQTLLKKWFKQRIETVKLRAQWKHYVTELLKI